MGFFLLIDLWGFFLKYLVEVKIKMKKEIFRQKTLFDDENSDYLFLVEELRKIRLKERKEKEKKAIQKYNEAYVASRRKNK